MLCCHSFELLWVVACPTIVRIDPNSLPRTSGIDPATPAPPSSVWDPAPSNALSRPCAASPGLPFPNRSDASTPPPTTYHAAARVRSRIPPPFSPTAPGSAAASDRPERQQYDSATSHYIQPSG